MGRTLGAKFSSRSVELLQNVLSNCCLHHFRKPDPVQPWWCLALSLMLRTQEQTAGPITEITSPSEVEGCNKNAFWLSAIYFLPPGSARTLGQATSPSGQTSWLCNSGQTGESMGRVRNALLPALISFQQLKRTLSLAALKVMSSMKNLEQSLTVWTKFKRLREKKLQYLRKLKT